MAYNEEKSKENDMKTLISGILISCKNLYENLRNKNDDNSEGEKRGWPRYSP